MTETQTTRVLPEAPLLGAEGERCADCGAVLAADQRYCVNCGLRRGAPRVDHRALLTPGGSAGAAGPGPGPAPAGSTRTLSPLGAAAAAGLLLLAVLVGALLGSRSGDETVKAPVVSVASGGAAQVGAPVTFTSDWGGGDGWTVRLQSFDKPTTTAAQVEAAEEAARAKGAGDVGSLDSDEHPSIGAGQYVVYSGRFETRKSARAALKRLQGRFPDAAVVEVSSSGPAGTTSGGEGGTGGGSPSASGADPAAKKQLEDLSSSSPEEYQKKSRKLPDKVSTGGKQVPKDDEAPRGGDQGGTTIK